MPPSSISLAGQWKFKLDQANQGIKEEWYKKSLDETIQLPGTTDEAKKGKRNEKRELGRFTRVYPYYGAAWYQKEVIVPSGWKQKHIVFLMERTKTTTVWVDNIKIGTKNTLVDAHKYDLSHVLTPGKHVITVRINNDEKPPVGDPHQISDQTQTNWNGIIGKLELNATDPVWIEDVKLYSNIHKKTALFKIKFAKNVSVPVDGKVSISGTSWNTKTPHAVSLTSWPVKTDTSQYFTVEIPLGNEMQLWDEFSPTLYRFNIKYKGKHKRKSYQDEKIVKGGMREFKTQGTSFSINGKPIFLRGKHDACVFPLTGYPPMTVEGWLRVFTIAKSYGINHYRFHTWCPPDAAFEAADIAGIYMQPELPIWGAIGESTDVVKGDVEQRTDNDPIQQRTRYLTSEGFHMLKAFGNHASFVMFALGNELSGSRPVMADMIKKFRSYDDRPLYAEGSNNFLWTPKLAPGDDYWTTTLTGGHYSAGNYRPDTKGKEVRSSYPVHTKGHINNIPMGTDYDYSGAIKDVPVPVIGHEIGQFQIYPNFNEIQKYKGVVEARNFEIYRERLKAAGMEDQADDFFRASGALAVLCYREDIETAIRTPGFGGFQLLDLQDFPGQGTALVGILDAFMDSKGLIEPKKWREFCSETVPLVRMKSFTWTTNQTFSAAAQVANYGQYDLKDIIAEWTLKSADGKLIASGKLPKTNIAQGRISDLGIISTDLNQITDAQKLILTLWVDKYQNSYPIWVYPIIKQEAKPQGITIVRNIDETVFKRLEKGGKVLLIPDSTVLKKTIPGAFQTDFWNYPMFKKYSPPGTMGILCDPKHPALAGFPTEFHSNWQWWQLVRYNPVMILNSMPKEFKPIVQVVDNFERNHKLGLLFEVAVGKGKLIVSSMDLLKQQENPEAACLLKSITDYMNSKKFNPGTSVNKQTLIQVLGI